MDTLTHTLIGATIVGLAHIDPAVDAVSAGFITTVVGASLIPDLDTVLKMKNNAKLKRILIWLFQRVFKYYLCTSGGKYVKCLREIIRF